MSVKTIFKTKIQVFVAIAWALIFIAMTYIAYGEYVHALENSQPVKDIIVTYLQMMAFTTGICFFAWGVIGVPSSYRVFSGQPPHEPFKMDEEEQDKSHNKR
jgi:hypothetical protein